MMPLSDIFHPYKVIYRSNPYAGSYNLTTWDGRSVSPTGGKRLGIPKDEIWIDEVYRPFTDLILFHELFEAKLIAQGVPEHEAHHRAEGAELAKFCGDEKWEQMIAMLGKTQLVEASRSCKIGGQQEMKPKVILTAPHATCPLLGSNHPCDVIAGDLTKKIASQLGAQGVAVRTFIGDIPRTEVDLNRDESKGRDYYRTFMDSVSPGTLHFDIHSYPPELDDFKNVDAVIYRMGNNSQLVDLLQRELSKNHKVGVIYGSSINTLVRDSQRQGAQSALIEFSESLQPEESKIASELAQIVLDNSVKFI